MMRAIWAHRDSAISRHQYLWAWWRGCTGRFGLKEIVAHAVADNAPDHAESSLREATPGSKSHSLSTDVAVRFILLWCDSVGEGIFHLRVTGAD
jgi:hypothetical protein